MVLGWNSEKRSSQDVVIHNYMDALSVLSFAQTEHPNNVPAAQEKVDRAIAAAKEQGISQARLDKEVELRINKNAGESERIKENSRKR